MTIFYLTPHGSSTHVIDPEAVALTFCGRGTDARGIKSSVQSSRACRSCMAGAMRRFVFPYQDEIEITNEVVARSLSLDARTIVEVEARVFTIQGHTGMYMVTLAEGLNPTCTCPIAKVNPLSMCKHMAAVITMANGLNKRLAGLNKRLAGVA